jgi:hypothetical protein
MGGKLDSGGCGVKEGQGGKQHTVGKIADGVLKN